MSHFKENFCVFGRNPVIEAFKSGRRFDKILIQKNLFGPEVKEILDFAKNAATPVQGVPKEKIESIVKKYSKHKVANHQGVVAFLSMIDYYSLDDVLHNVYAKGEIPFLLILDGITDVGNFGAIARSAECLGAHAIIVPNQGSAQINAEAMKASAGALNRILVCREKDLITPLNSLKENGIKIYGAGIEGATEISHMDFTVPCAIVLGSEGSGISKAVSKLCDEKMKIPMKGNTESLNVSVSAGIILYEASKQRNIKLNLP